MKKLTIVQRAAEYLVSLPSVRRALEDASVEAVERAINDVDMNQLVERAFEDAQVGQLVEDAVKDIDIEGLVEEQVKSSVGDFDFNEVVTPMVEEKLDGLDLQAAISRVLLSYGVITAEQFNAAHEGLTH